MRRELTGTSTRLSWRAAGRALFHVPLAVIAICCLLLAMAASRLPGGVNLSGGPDILLALAVLAGFLGFMIVLIQPESRIAAAVEALAIFTLVALFGTLASLALAVSPWPFIDAQLDTADRVLFPWLELRAIILALPHYPLLQSVLRWIYGSMVWQPLALITVVAIAGRRSDQEFFLSAWALGLLGCLLPFYFVPALSPYVYWGIMPQDVGGFIPGMQRDLPLLLGLRDGSITTISINTIGGLVTVPSFHACAATVLAVSWWRWRLLRWPMLALNIGMALAAVPIGSHYAIDIVAGVTVGLLACWIAARVLRAKDRWHVPHAPTTGDAPLAPLPA